MGISKYLYRSALTVILRCTEETKRVTSNDRVLSYTDDLTTGEPSLLPITLLHGNLYQVELGKGETITLELEDEHIHYPNKTYDLRIGCDPISIYGITLPFKYNVFRSWLYNLVNFGNNLQDKLSGGNNPALAMNSIYHTTHTELLLYVDDTVCKADMYTGTNNIHTDLTRCTLLELLREYPHVYSLVRNEVSDYDNVSKFTLSIIPTDVSDIIYMRHKEFHNPLLLS